MRVKLTAGGALAALALLATAALALPVNTVAVTTSALRSIAVPARTPVPMRATPPPTPTIAPQTAAVRRALPPLPPMPKTSGSVRRILSATGACIAFVYNANCTLASGNQNVVAGQTITWQAEKLPATTAYQDYVLVPGNAGTPAAVGAPYNGPTGPTETQANVVAGVYVFASLNKSANTWDAIAYVLVGSPVSIETYADGALSTKTQTFTTSATGATTVYVATQGLSPLDKYAVGIENQLTGNCVFTAPSSTPTATLCNLGAVTGTNPTGGGLLLANWGVQLPTSPAQAGTFVATVFDQTTGQRVTSRQFSVVDGRTTGMTGRVDLEFTNGLGTTSTTASAQRIAFNGTAVNVNDPAQTYLDLLFGATNLPPNPPNGDSYTLVVSDPGGNVAYTVPGNTNYNSTIITPTYNTWGLPFETIPFEQAFSGSTWTATIYDATAKKLVAAQSFQILGYSASVLFQNPASQSLTIPASGTITNGITYTNTADQIFGANNGDPIRKFVTTTAGNQSITSITLTPPGSTTACTPAPNCTASYTDSTGNAWTVTLAATGGGNFSITSVPVNPSQPLMPNASLSVPGLTFSGTNQCKGSASNPCSMTTSITPTDMIGASGTAGSQGNNVANPINFIAAGALNATGSVAIVGYYDGAGAWHAVQDAGYTSRFNQALFALNQPFTNAASKVVFSYTLTNASTANGTISIFDLLMPSGFNQSTAAYDSHSPNVATVTTNGYCDGLPRATICVQPQTAVANGTSRTYYLSIAPPTPSFSYTDVVATDIQDSYSNKITPTTISPTSSSVQTFIGSPTQVDSMALGAYSLNGGLMIGQLAPGSVGTNTSNTLTFNVRNTPAGSDPFPDEVDFAAVQIPAQSYASFPTSCSGLTVNTSGWSCLYATSSAGQPTTYLFGECSQQISLMPTVPASAASLGSDKMTICPFALPNEPYSLTAGGILSVSIPVTTGATQTPAGSPIAITTWAHGATTNGWTTPIISTLAVNPSAAAGVGFSQISSPAGGLAPVTSGTEPQIVGNYNATTGNTYLYTVHNTGNVDVTSVTIGIPGPDTTGTNGADAGGTIWKLTSAPTLTVEGVGNADGCTATYTNPTSGLDTSGNITITCPAGALSSGRTLDVQFNALAPDKINSTYNWPATVNGTTSAATANWFADTEILIALSANVAVSVNPTAACTTAGVTVTTATQTVDFGNVAANSNRACVDSMAITVTTDAASPTTWGLYVSASGNPARTATTGSPNELNVETDATNSTSAAMIPCPTSVAPPCFAYSNTTAYTPIQLTSAGAGTQVAGTTGSGTGANNSPVKVYLNTQVSIGTETVPATGESETITVTWIAN